MRVGIRVRAKGLGSEIKGLGFKQSARLRCVEEQRLALVITLTLTLALTKTIPLKTTQANRVDITPTLMLTLLLTLLLTLILTLLLTLILTQMQPRPHPKPTSKPNPNAQYKDKERWIEEGVWDQGWS
jgi:hypothetical protein